MEMERTTIMIDNNRVPSNGKINKSLSSFNYWFNWRLFFFLLVLYRLFRHDGICVDWQQTRVFHRPFELNISKRHFYVQCYQHQLELERRKRRKKWNFGIRADVFNHCYFGASYFGNNNRRVKRKQKKGIEEKLIDFTINFFSFFFSYLRKRFCYHCRPNRKALAEFWKLFGSIIGCSGFISSMFR